MHAKIWGGQSSYLINRIEESHVPTLDIFSAHTVKHGSTTNCTYLILGLTTFQFNNCDNLMLNIYAVWSYIPVLEIWLVFNIKFWSIKHFSVPLSNGLAISPKMHVVDVSKMFAEAIRRIHNGESMSALFTNITEDWRSHRLVLGTIHWLQDQMGLFRFNFAAWLGSSVR